MTTCVFCHDNLDDHHGNLQYPGGSRWLCGTCVTWAVTTRYLQDREAASHVARAEAAEVERKAAELATGVDEDATDAVFELYDTMMANGEFEALDSILGNYDTSSATIQELLDRLTFTLPAADKLPARAGFYNRARARITELAPGRVDRLLQCLEGSRFVGYDSHIPEQQIIWTGDTIPHAADGLTAMPAGVVEIEDTQG